MNFPLPPGATGDVYLQAFDDVIAPVVERSPRRGCSSRLGSTPTAPTR